MLSYGRMCITYFNKILKSSQVFYLIALMGVEIKNQRLSIGQETSLY